MATVHPTVLGSALALAVVASVLVVAAGTIGFAMERTRKSLVRRGCSDGTVGFTVLAVLIVCFLGGWLPLSLVLAARWARRVLQRVSTA